MLFLSPHDCSLASKQSRRNSRFTKLRNQVSCELPRMCTHRWQESMVGRRRRCTNNRVRNFSRWIRATEFKIADQRTESCNFSRTRGSTVPFQRGSIEIRSIRLNQFPSCFAFIGDVWWEGTRFPIKNEWNSVLRSKQGNGWNFEIIFYSNLKGFLKRAKLLLSLVELRFVLTNMWNQKAFRIITRIA